MKKGTRTVSDLSLLIPPDSDTLPHLAFPPWKVNMEQTCQSNNKDENRRVATWKLGILLAIACASLVIMVVITQHLVLRHFRTEDNESKHPVTFEIEIPDNQWISSEDLHQKLTFPWIDRERNSEEKFSHESMNFGEKDGDIVKDSTMEKVASFYQQETEYFPAQDIDNMMVKFHSPLTLEAEDGFTLVEDGMYWSQEVEANIDPGLSEDIIEAEIKSLGSRKVKSLDEPSWLKCGRDQNRFVTFQDGVHACARYREPYNQLVLGELMSFYLARLLGIHNIPAVVLSQVDPNNPVWSSAMADVTSAKWRVGSVVAIIQWVEGLARDRMPDMVRRALLGRTTIDVTSDSPHLPGTNADSGVGSLRDLDMEEAGKMAQWSDLVVFDFLTGNYDRVSSMQDAAEKENRSALLSETVHNLAVSTRTGSLWLIDNESGMLDSYNLLYPQFADPESISEAHRFQIMQRDLLQTTCIFRRNTVDRVFSLYRAGDSLPSILDTFISSKEPFYKELLASVAGRDTAYRTKFHERVTEVWTWMKQCQESVHFW